MGSWAAKGNHTHKHEQVDGVIARSHTLSKLLSFDDEPALLRATHVCELTAKGGHIFDLGSDIGSQRRRADAFNRSFGLLFPPETWMQTQTQTQTQTQIQTQLQTQTHMQRTQAQGQAQAKVHAQVQATTKTKHFAFSRRIRWVAKLCRTQTQKRIHTFVSHNWASSPRLKYIAISLHFHLTWGLYGALGVAAVDLAWRVAVGGQRWNGLLHATATPVMLLVTFFLRNCVAPCGLRGPSVFMDACCISQTDPDQQRRGINKLGAFMHSSDHLFICYSQLYLKRLWTVYEVGAFLAVNQPHCISIVPLNQTIFALVMSLCFWLLGACFVALRFTSKDGPASSTVQEVVFNGLLACLLIAAACMMIVVPYTRFHLLRLERLLWEVRSFEVRTAECFREEDREYVEAAIVQLMRHVRCDGLPRDAEVSRETLLDDFNTIVRRDVPKAIRYSTGVLGMPLRDLIILCSVPISTLMMEDCSYQATCNIPFHLSGPLRCATGLCLGAFFCSSACAKWGELSRAANAAYMVAIILGTSLIFTACAYPWEIHILLTATQNQGLKWVEVIYTWLRALAMLALTVLVWQRSEATKAVTPFHFVAEPEFDTFTL